MRNTNLLPRSKVVTFFVKGTGQSSVSDGPPPVMAAPVAPSGSDVKLIIHLAHYYDWTPKLDDSSSSEVSGLPSDSSVASSKQPRLLQRFASPAREWAASAPTLCFTSKGGGCPTAAGRLARQKIPSRTVRGFRTRLLGGRLEGCRLLLWEGL
jgi:hypothetical protein